MLRRRLGLWLFSLMLTVIQCCKEIAWNPTRIDSALGMTTFVIVLLDQRNIETIACFQVVICLLLRKTVLVMRYLRVSSWPGFIVWFEDARWYFLIKVASYSIVKGVSFVCIWPYLTGTSRDFKKIGGSDWNYVNNGGDSFFSFGFYYICYWMVLNSSRALNKWSFGW